jgi:hypothetical protein
MNWYYSIRGAHTHVRVFMNGGKCGDLCFRNEEFRFVKEQHKLDNECIPPFPGGEYKPLITFIDETPEKNG